MEEQLSNTALVECYFSALNTADLDCLRAVLDPDVELRPTGSRPRTGLDEAISFLRRVFELFPEHRDTPTRIIEAGDTVVVEIDFSARSVDGREIAFEAVDVFDLADGRIVRLSQWFDTADLKQQVGGA